MKTVTIHSAKTNLSRLIEDACAGEDVVIARGKVPVVRIVPVKAAARGRKFGALKGRAKADEKFFEPLPADELAAWER
jgi:antitoxin (DNA-binding transcriptional repressor) of toxin-antitoxin stability system